MRAFVAAVAAALAVSASAGAATPAVQLAKQLKTDMQKNYDRHKSGFVFTTVTCKIAADASGAACKAHFTDKSARAIGVIQVKIVPAAGGGVSYQPVSIRCTDSKTAAKLKC